MLTSKERAQLRAQANAIDTIVHIGKSGIGENLIKQANDALEARELIKCRVLEAAMLTPAEACQALAEATGAEGVAVIGTKFVLYRHNPRLHNTGGTAKAKPKKVNPVKEGAKRRAQLKKAERERRNEYFRTAAKEKAEGGQR